MSKSICLYCKVELELLVAKNIHHCPRCKRSFLDEDLGIDPRQLRVQPEWGELTLRKADELKLRRRGRASLSIILSAFLFALILSGLGHLIMGFGLKTVLLLTALLLVFSLVILRYAFVEIIQVSQSGITISTGLRSKLKKVVAHYPRDSIDQIFLVRDVVPIPGDENRRPYWLNTYTLKLLAHDGQRSAILDCSFDSKRRLSPLNACRYRDSGLRLERCFEIILGLNDRALEAHKKREPRHRRG